MIWEGLGRGWGESWGGAGEGLEGKKSQKIEISKERDLKSKKIQDQDCDVGNSGIVIYGSTVQPSPKPMIIFTCRANM